MTIPDPVAKVADHLAGQLGISRSELYRRALSEYLGDDPSIRITEAINVVVDSIGEPPDAAIMAQSRYVLKWTEW